MTKHEFNQFGTYEGSFPSYEKLVENSDPDLIYINGGPDEEMSNRFELGIYHYGNFLEREKHPKFMAPEAEASNLKQKTGYWENPPVVSSTGFEGGNRLSEYKSLHSNIEGNEEIHFVTSDYCIGEDRVLQEHVMPEVEGEFVGVKTDKNSSTEKLKRRIYAKALKFSDRF